MRCSAVACHDSIFCVARLSTFRSLRTEPLLRLVSHSLGGPPRAIDWEIQPQCSRVIRVGGLAPEPPAWLRRLAGRCPGHGFGVIGDGPLLSRLMSVSVTIWVAIVFKADNVCL